MSSFDYTASAGLFAAKRRDRHRWQARVKQTKKSIKNFSDADTPERHYQFVAPSHRTAASQDQVW